MSAPPIARKVTDAISSSPLSMRTNFAWIFVGNVVYGICQWGIIVAIAKLGASWQLGQYALALAISAPVMLLANLQLRQVLATDARGTFRFGNYVSLRLLTSAGALVVVAVLVVMLGYRAETGIVVLLVAVAKAIDSLSDVFFGWLQFRERMSSVGLSMAVNGIVSFLASALAMYLTHSIVAVGLASATGSAAAFSVALFGYSASTGFGRLAKTASRYRLAVGPPVWSLARLCLPLGAVMFLISVNANIPRYVIQRDLGEGQLGVYAAVGYVLIVGMTLLTSVGQAASPRLAKYYASGDKAAFLRLLRLLLMLGCFLALAVMFLVETEGRRIVLELYGRDYSGNLSFFTVLAAAAGLDFIVSFMGFALTAARYYLAQAPLLGAAVAVTAVGSAISVPRYGLAGAAWIVLGSSTLQLVGAAAILVIALRNMGRGSSASRHELNSAVSGGPQAKGSIR